jgi:hypothetical protein
MRPGLFICGCDPASEKIKGYRMEIVPGTDILSPKAHDYEGYEVCPVHGKRMYGWGTTHKDVPHPDTAKQMTGNVSVKSTMPDLRDNRDPTALGLALLSKTNGGTKAEATA